MHVCFLPCEEKCSDRETNTVSSEVHLSSSTLGLVQYFMNWLVLNCISTRTQNVS